MGQKTHPIGFRLGVTKPWQARWFARGAQYRENLHEDIRIRRFVLEYLAHAMVARVETVRTPQRLALVIHTARPGAVIGRKGSEVNALRQMLAKMSDRTIDISIEEIANPAGEAALIAQSVASQLERRISFRRAIRRAVGDARRAGVGGVKVMIAGRLGGSEIARTEWMREGRVPLHTLRADIDYGFATAKTTHGTIGVKVWVFKGEIIGAQAQAEAARGGRRAGTAGGGEAAGAPVSPVAADVPPPSAEAADASSAPLPAAPQETLPSPEEGA